MFSHDISGKFSQLNLSNEESNAQFIQLLESYIQQRKFYLPERILIRESKNVDPVTTLRKITDYRFELLGNEIGRGTFGSVVKVRATLKITESGQCVIKTKKPGCERVLKAQKSVLGDLADPEFQKRIDQFRRDVINEHKFNCMTDYIHSKPPVFCTFKSQQYHYEVSHLVSRFFPGVNLEQLLLEEYQCIRMLTVEQRVLLTKNLLKALNDLHERALIVHRDIKPPNIMIDQYFNVYIIDLGLSVEKDGVGGVPRGTPLYMPLDAYDTREGGGSTKVERDIFSMGLVLSEVWHADKNRLLNESSSMSFSEKKLKMASQNSNVVLSGLFDGLLFLNRQLRGRIENIIYKMIGCDPRQRCSLDEAIKLFENIYLDMLLEKHVNVRFDEYRQAYLLGLDLLDRVSAINKTFRDNGQLYQTNYFQKLKEVVLQQLAQVSDEKPYLDCFLGRIGIASLCHQKSREEVGYAMESLIDFYALKFKKIESRQEEAVFFTKEFRRHYYSLEALFAMKEKFEKKTVNIKIVHRAPISRHTSCFFATQPNLLNNNDNIQLNAQPR